MDIRRHLASYSSTGVKTSTVQRKIAIFRSFFDWMENEEYILKSPMRKIKSLKLEKRLRKALTFEELEKIRDICNTYRERALLEFFYSTGCRLDEVVKLNKQDIDWQDLSTRVIGKGNKERTVFINAKAKVFLQKYLMSRLDDCEALFVTIRKPFRRMKRRAIEREISNIGKRIGLHIYPHLIRHTTATCMLHNGAELYEVQRVLGHEYPSTTQIYAQISDDSIKNAHRKYLAN
jgi:integrase/recombinase XerD